MSKKVKNSQPGRVAEGDIWVRPESQLGVPDVQQKKEDYDSDSVTERRRRGKEGGAGISGWQTESSTRCPHRRASSLRCIARMW